MDSGSPNYPTAEVEGFTLGMFVSYGDCGDAWVRAPDGSVGTLVWETGEPIEFMELIAPDPNGRWGTFSVRLPLPMTSNEEAARFLEALLPQLFERWTAWKRVRDRGPRF